MRATQSLILVCALFLIAPLALAQDEMEMPAPPPPTEDAMMDARVGSWSGTGTMMGMPVSETMTAQWAVGHRFVMYQSTMTMTAPDGTVMPMEMHMVTKPNGDGTYDGMYLDSWGSMGEYASHVDESGTMVMEWADPIEGANHRATEVMNPDGSGWTMTFFTQGEDGSWVESGSMIYTRAAQ